MTCTRKTPLFATRGKCTVHYQPICLVLARQRDVNGNEKFLWSLVYDSNALRKDQSSRERREFGAKTASIVVWNSSDLREISFAAIAYLISYLNYSSIVLYSMLKIRLRSFLSFVWTLLIGICCSFVPDEFNRRRNIKISDFFETFSHVIHENWRNFKLFVFKECNFFQSIISEIKGNAKLASHKQKNKVKNKLNKSREYKGKI